MSGVRMHNTSMSFNFRTGNGNKDKITLLCHECKNSFENAWDLIVHVQAAHMINVYELGSPKNDVKSDRRSSSPSPRRIERDTDRILRNGVSTRTFNIICRYLPNT